MALLARLMQAKKWHLFFLTCRVLMILSIMFVWLIAWKGDLKYRAKSSPGLNLILVKGNKLCPLMEHPLNDIQWNGEILKDLVLGPLLFSLYISPIEDIIDSHGLSGLIYADNTQIYMSIQPSQRPEMLRLIEGCLNDMCRWFNDYKLVCNRDKTQFMYFTSKFKSSPKSVCINLDSTILDPTNTIRNLGVV